MVRTNYTKLFVYHRSRGSLQFPALPIGRNGSRQSTAEQKNVCKMQCIDDKRKHPNNARCRNFSKKRKKSARNLNTRRSLAERIKWGARNDLLSLLVLAMLPIGLLAISEYILRSQCDRRRLSLKRIPTHSVGEARKRHKSTTAMATAAVARNAREEENKERERDEEREWERRKTCVYHR